MFCTFNVYSIRPKLFSTNTFKTNFNFNIPISKKIAKPILLDIQNNSCLMCNQKFSNWIPYQIHHIDHNSKNNTFSNFVALCCNCHSGIHRHNLLFPITKYNNMLNNNNIAELLKNINCTNTIKKEYLKKISKKK